MSEVTRVLSAIEQGDPHAAHELLPLVYEELRKLAAQRLAGENPGHTLEPTALVHEAYLRLVGGDQVHYNDRRHFFATAAASMRRILIDNARRKLTHKRDGGRRRPLGDVAAVEQDEELVALDDALTRLAALDPIKAQLVELRYFAGLSGEQAAQVLGVSPTTADRYWAFARAWLQTAVRGK